MSFLNRIALAIMLLAPYYSAVVCAEDPENPNTTKSVNTGAIVFARIRSLLSSQSCSSEAASSKWMKNYIHDTKQFGKDLERMLPLLDYVSQQADKKSLPGEFVLIPFVESRYIPSATAKGGPAGLWQMMPNTAKHFGVVNSKGHDGRYSAVHSTNAALNYLSQLHNEFKHWPTAVMAYNTGDSRMRILLKRQGLSEADAHQRLPTGLAAHTYAYVRKLEALSCFMLEPERFNMSLPLDVEFKPLRAKQQ